MSSTTTIPLSFALTRLAKALHPFSSANLHPAGRGVVMARLEASIEDEDDITFDALMACILRGEDPHEAMREIGLLNAEGGDEVCPDPACHICNPE